MISSSLSPPKTLFRKQTKLLNFRRELFSNLMQSASARLGNVFGVNYRDLRFVCDKRSSSRAVGYSVRPARNRFTLSNRETMSEKPQLWIIAC